MKITRIEVTLEPHLGEINKMIVHLIRSPEKMWSILEHDGVIRGLYPSEIELADNIQKLIISKFNDKEQ